MSENWLPSLAPDGLLKISEESARAEIEKLTAYYETDYSDLPEDRKKVISELISVLVRGFRQGRLQIDERDGEPWIIQHVGKKDEKLEYRPIDGKTKVRMETAGEGSYAKIYSVMGILSGLGADAIQKLKAADLKLAENLGAYFLSA
jgi:hypothetical protein